MTLPARMLPATSMANASRVHSSMTVRHLICWPVAEVSNTKSYAQTWFGPVGGVGRGRLSAMRRRGRFGGQAILILGKPIPALAEHLVVRVARAPPEVEKRLHVEVECLVVRQVVPRRERAQVQPVEHAEGRDREARRQARHARG